MCAKLQAQPALRRYGPCKNEQAARLLVEALDHPQARLLALARASFLMGDEMGHDLVERRIEGSPPSGPVAFEWVPNAREPRGLFDDDKVGIEVANADRFILVRLCCRLAAQLHDL